MEWYITGVSEFLWIEAQRRMGTWESWDVRAGRPQRGVLNHLGFLFLYICLHAPLQIGLARRAVFFTWGSHSGLWIFFCSIFTSFSLSLSFSHRHFGLLFPTLITQHFPLKRWGAQFFGSRGVEVSLATSCWAGMARDLGPPPRASLRPQSPYSDVHLRVSYIFHGQV